MKAQMLIHADVLTNVSWMLGTLLIVLAAVVLANIVDFVSAIMTARQLGISVQSAKMRHALDKLVKYFLLVGVAFAADAIIATLELTHIAYCTIISGLIVCAVEIKSVFEHNVRRRDKVAKIPESMHELIAWIGEEKAKAVLMQIVKGAVKKVTDVEIDLSE